MFQIRKGIKNESEFFCSENFNRNLVQSELIPFRPIELFAITVNLRKVDVGNKNNSKIVYELWITQTPITKMLCEVSNDAKITPSHYL